MIIAAAAAAGFYFGKQNPANVAPAAKNTEFDQAAADTAAATASKETPIKENELTPIKFEPEPEILPAADKNESGAKPAVEVQDAETKISNQTAESNVAGEPTESARSERFAIMIGQNAVDTVATNLKKAGFIGDETKFKAAIKPGILALVPGGYKLSKGMTEAQVATILQHKPYMKWIIVPEGLRKEEIAAMMADELEWTDAQKSKWITTDTTTVANYSEGVYFPDTYLIPVDEESAKTAARMQARFNEAFSNYLPQFNQQNIKWTTGLTFASIVQREAKSAADMPLIAGILWNRLEQGMTLNADATLQYACGDAGNGWWAPATAADKAIDSPYNTYINKGLPPHPICSPGIAAIEATLNPATTDCLYYLHGNDGATHCAPTYEDH